MIVSILYALLGFTIAIMVLVAVHEFGHFWVARKCGVKVERFCIGMGKPFWKYVSPKDGCEFGIAPYPIGGYVKMLGEQPGVELSEEEKKQALNYKPVWQRMAIVLAGPIANFILAIIVYWILYMMGVTGPAASIYGVYQNSPADKAGVKAMSVVKSIDGETVFNQNALYSKLINARINKSKMQLELEDKSGKVSKHVVDLSNINTVVKQHEITREIGILLPPISTRIKKVTKNTPADKAGLKAGDVLLEANGQTVDHFIKLSEIIKARVGKPTEFKIQREGSPPFTKTITPVMHKEKCVSYPIIGFTPDTFEQKKLIESYGPVAAFGVALDKTYDSSLLLVRFVKKLITTEAHSSNISGVITIGRITGGILETKKLSAREKFEAFLLILAALSVTLGVLNLLPIPMLDGGHFVYYLYEAVTGHPVSENFVKYATVLGLSFLLSLMVLALYNDLVSLFGCP